MLEGIEESENEDIEEEEGEYKLHIFSFKACSKNKSSLTKNTLKNGTPSLLSKAKGFFHNFT